MNPLLQDSPLPLFDQIQAEHVEPAIDLLIAQNLAAIETLLAEQTNPTWQSLIAPLEDLDDKLNSAWSSVSHLNAVVNTPDLRAAYNRCLSKLTDYETQIGQNEVLYQAYKALSQSPEFVNLNQAQKKSIEYALRDFKLSGVALPAPERAEFARLTQVLSEKQSKFQDNVMDATDNWHLDIALAQADRLAGIPEQNKLLAHQAAEQAKITGYRLTLDAPCYQAVMMFADDRELRQSMHYAYATRASELGDLRFDNSVLIEEIMATRHALATLLEFKDYSAYSLATKMAKTPETVMGFLETLAKQAKPFAKVELKALEDFAQAAYGISELAPWDMAYYGEKLRQAQFSISQEEVRPYFPVERVLSGMFEVVKRLYGLTITPKSGVATWHRAVQFFEIRDAQAKLRGQFYLDLFARAQKRGGAWMDEARVRRRLSNGEIQVPVAYLVCNFRPPVGDAPALLTHEESLTLFHEFGHGLHHLLTQIEVPAVSGINGVPWDAVELPSQFMENWCWQKEALQFISGHYESHQPLPEDLLHKMHAAKNFQSGMHLLRQLEFSLFDFWLHLTFDPATGAQVPALLEKIRGQYAVVPTASYNRFAHSFSHIFAGGYSAGYYSYLWAEVLSSDAFSQFEQKGIFNAQVGRAFLEKILEKGGSEDPAVLFRDFQGRDPEVSHLLQHHGLS